MNFKHWLLNEENTIPEDDGTLGWWDEIASKNPKSLLDVAERYLNSIGASKKELNTLKQMLVDKDEKIFVDILSKRDCKVIGYWNFVTNKNRNKTEDIKYGEGLNKFINYVETNFENALPKPLKWHVIESSDFKHIARHAFSKDVTTEKKPFRNLPVKGKLYPEINAADPNFFVAMKEIMDYYASGFNRGIYTWSEQFKIPDSTRRRDCLVLYLSEEGVKNKSTITNDIKNILLKSGTNSSGKIQFGYDDQHISGEKDNNLTFNAYKTWMLSLLAAVSNMDDGFVKKAVNYLKNYYETEAIRVKWFGIMIKTAILNTTNYEPLNNYLRSRNIDLKSSLGINHPSEKPPETSPDKPQIQSDKTGSIYLGKVHVQLVGNNLKVQGSKAMFDVRLEPNQLQQIASLTKLEAIMGNEPISPVDYSKGGRSAGIEIKRLGDAEVHISKNALHLNNIQITLNQNQIQYILNMLGMDDTAFDQGNTKNSAVNLTAENGKTVKISNNFFIGKSHFSDAPDFDRFYSERQFNLMKDTTGSWTIQHDPKATNQTYLNGTPLNQPQKLSSGMEVTVGKSGKCPLTIEIK